MQADLFCRVIDNFGDIGVTWRLARQLQREFGWAIRLWVDELDSFRQIEPRIELLAHQNIGGIEVIQWFEPPDLIPAPIVLSMFSCELPTAYLARMHARQTCWINLEYLSAEDWVESCHGMPALRADGLASHFFFPGFTERTGGLLREADLFTRRDAWQADRLAQRDFLAQLGLCEAALDAWSCRSPESRGAESEGAESTGTESPATESPATEAVCPQLRPYEPAPMLVSLFCYPDIPLQSLTDTLACAARPIILLVPAGIAPDLHSGQYGQLLVERIPFLPQAEYDKVLWTCDLNFVRGEDSILRALWSGKPLIWQIYPQTEHTHLLKLDAWLKRAALPGLVQTLMQAWNQSDQERFACTLRGSLEPDSFQQWQEQAARFCQEQSGLPDLAGALNQFCVQQQHSQIKAQTAIKAALLEKG